ncbi:MAG: folate-binding protein YgfZ [Proteobacteria bacterium]|nr:folate-binding protein YgfZ [Pseudomonadota bacterium]
MSDGSSVVADLGPASVVSLTGPDALRFANGLFTNHVGQLADGGAQRHAACDARGRITGMMDLLRVDPERFVVVVEGAQAADFIAHYGRYLLMDDAELDDQSDGRRHLTIQGPDAEQRLRAAGFEVPSADAIVTDEVIVFRRGRAGMQGFDVITRSSNALGDAHPDFEALRVAAGDVRWPVDMSEKQLVHELGLRDQLLSFEKGCYIGQETINRLDVRGGVKQRLVGLRLPGALEAGAELSADGKKVGTLRSPVEHPSLGWIGLAVVRMPHDEPGTALQIGDVHAQVVGLPIQ